MPSPRHRLTASQGQELHDFPAWLLASPFLLLGLSFLPVRHGQARAVSGMSGAGAQGQRPSLLWLLPHQARKWR